MYLEAMREALEREREKDEREEGRKDKILGKFRMSGNRMEEGRLSRRAWAGHWSVPNGGHM